MHNTRTPRALHTAPENTCERPNCTRLGPLPQHSHAAIVVACSCAWVKSRRVQCLPLKNCKLGAAAAVAAAQQVVSVKHGKHHSLQLWAVPGRANPFGRRDIKYSWKTTQRDVVYSHKQGQSTDPPGLRSLRGRSQAATASCGLTCVHSAPSHPAESRTWRAPCAACLQTYKTHTPQASSLVVSNEFSRRVCKAQMTPCTL